MARCRTCSREIDRAVVRGGRVELLCACADRTPVRCSACRAPLHSGGAREEVIEAECRDCWESVVLDLRGVELRRGARTTRKPKPPTRPRRRDDVGEREAGPSAAYRQERDEGGVRVRRVRSNLAQGYRSMGGAVEIERGAKDIPLPPDVRFVMGGAAVFVGLLVVTLGASGLFDLSAAERMVLVTGVGAMAIVAWVLGADRARHDSHRRTIQEERADQTIRVRVDDEAVHGTPRGGWDGKVELDRIREVRVVPGAEGMRRVRIELTDGSAHTLVEGLECDVEVELVVRQIEDAVRVARARATTGSIRG